jgi:hypothetical protein
MSRSLPVSSLTSVPENRLSAAEQDRFEITCIVVVLSQFPTLLSLAILCDLIHPPDYCLLRLRASRAARQRLVFPKILS